MLRIFDCHLIREGDNGLEVLLLHRAPEALYAGTWRMVAGKVEHGERAWEAAVREIGEETGLAVLRLFAVPVANSFYDPGADTLRQAPVFLAVVGEGEPVLDDEHDAWEWVSTDEAEARLPWPGQRAGLRAGLDLLGRDAEIAPHLEVDLA